MRDFYLLSKIKQFKPQEIVNSEDTGNIDYVYFVLSGQCMILQCLKLMKVRARDGKTQFKLAEITDVASEFEKVSRRRSSRMSELGMNNALQR
jgi:hypothetical protein